MVAMIRLSSAEYRVDDIYCGQHAHVSVGFSLHLTRFSANEAKQTTPSFLMQNEKQHMHEKKKESCEWRERGDSPSGINIICTQIETQSNYETV